VGQIEMTNAMKAVRIEKMGMQKTWQLIYRHQQSKINSKERDRQTD
jgi:hypothetical protein